jgi:hypothetical protein
MSICLPAINIPAACIPSIAYSQTVANQTTTFDYVTIFTTPSAGVYRVSIGLFVAGSDGGVGTVNGQYLWGESSLNNGASFGGSSLYPGNEVFTFRLGSDIDLQWQVSSLTSVDHYDLSIIVEQLLDS